MKDESFSFEEQVADALFTNSFGEAAHRLCLLDTEGRNLGGWCRAVVIDRLRKFRDMEVGRLQAELSRLKQYFTLYESDDLGIDVSTAGRLYLVFKDTGEIRESSTETKYGGGTRKYQVERLNKLWAFRRTIDRAIQEEKRLIDTREAEEKDGQRETGV